MCQLKIKRSFKGLKKELMSAYFFVGPPNCLHLETEQCVWVMLGRMENLSL